VPLSLSDAAAPRPARGGTEAALAQLIKELRVTWRPMIAPVSWSRVR
jgi:hypothetical protein